MSDETATFRLVYYFPHVYRIIQRCFMPEVRFNEGIVNVASGHKFHVWLSGVSRLNETVVWEGLNQVDIANMVTFA